MTRFDSFLVEQDDAREVGADEGGEGGVNGLHLSALAALAADVQDAQRGVIR